MNEQQKKWTENHCEELRTYLKNHPNLTDKECEAATGYVSVVVSLSKDNKEVRSALFDVLEEFDRSEKK
jgi:hypothetical protein